VLHVPSLRESLDQLGGSRLANDHLWVGFALDATAGRAVDCESVARVYLSCPARMTKRFARMFATRQKVEKRASASVDPRELAWEVVTAPLVGAQGRMIWALTEEYRDTLSGLSVASFGAETATYYLAKATLAELRQHPKRRARVYRFGAGIS